MDCLFQFEVDLASLGDIALCAPIRYKIVMVQFPDPRNSTPEGIVAVGGSLDIETLKAAYTQGIFPWPHEGYPLLWFCPDPRGVLDFKDLHISESLIKFSRKVGHWQYTINEAFEQVIKECRLQKRPGQKGTWINSDMQAAYIDFFKAGYIQSLECWENGQLIGGIYGVDINGVFSGESMFFKKDNASKMCLWKMVEHLQSQGREWMDIQMVTPMTSSFGGKYISRNEFLLRIHK